MSEYRYLFEKTLLGKIEVKNHFVRSATFEGNATEDGFPTEATMKVYKKLAEGGIGTIISSYTYITDYEQPQKMQLGIYKDQMIPAYRELTDMVHAYGSRIVMQIVHGSSWGQGYPATAKILGPSVVTFEKSGITPREMTKEDIKDVIGRFADAAERVKKAGFDGVQIHCAHSYLLAQFISPIYNRRTDEYGGNTENRFRMVREVYTAVRERVGSDYPVWIKINCSDEQEGGLSADEFLFGCRELDQMGMDCFEVSGELWYSHKAEERAYYEEPATRLTDQIKADVILTGGLRTMEDIAQICDRSQVRYFGFARPLMKNPGLIRAFENENR